VDTLGHVLSDASLMVMTFGYAGIFVAMLIEGSGIPLPFPGAALLAFVGYTAWRGGIDVAQASIVAAAGSTAGSYLLFRLCRDAGPQLLERLRSRIALTPDRLSSASSWFETHAGRATFFARLTPGVRVYISAAAGFAHMNQGIFVVSTFAGTLLWSLLFIVGGWALGESWHRLLETMNAIQTTLVAGGIVLLIALFLVSRSRSQKNIKP
jgi:membrane protein DedA with SNARE-associated domain